MSTAESEREDIQDFLLEDVVTPAREQAPETLYVECGLGGGGETLVQALWEASGHDPTGSVVDLVGASGIGPEAPVPSTAGRGWRIVLVRGTANGPPEATSLATSDRRERLFRHLLKPSCVISPEGVEVLVSKFDSPTALIPELTETKSQRGLSARSVIEICEALPSMKRLRELTTGGGQALLDLGRALCLMEPTEIELSDEWALLAKALSGRNYSTADLSLVLQANPGLFAVNHNGRRTTVRPSSKLARELLLGVVRPSQSEHFAVYRALRDRAIAALARRDDSDPFIRRQLPRQARAATALRSLASDPLGILSSDPFALLRELELQPRELRRPAGKMIALSAHRLLTGKDRASQLELSARRVGLHDFADTLAEKVPARRWRPLWAQAELAHTHRVAFEHRSPLLTVAATTDAAGVAFVGSADGEVWRISPYHHSARLDGSKELHGEIRAIAACVVDGAPLVGVGTSTHAIGVLDGALGELKWLDKHAHLDPLSAAAINPSQGGSLLTAGVGGTIFVHPLVDGSGRGRVLYEHGSEIRDLRIVSVGETEMVVFCAVDGVVGIVHLDDGALVAHWHMAEEVLNSVSAVVDGNSLRLVVGTSQGSLLQLRTDAGTLNLTGGRGAARAEQWDVLGRHPLAVNSVRMVLDGDGFAVLSGSSDGSWQWNNRGGMRQLALGHVGPIWSIDCMDVGERRYVVTAGGEGACRLWLTQAVLGEQIASSQPLAHRGPVSAIELAADPGEKILVITGGSDGDVRLGAPHLPEGGELLTHHDSEISALLSISLDGDRSHVVSGSVDGALRLTSANLQSRRGSTVLGIAHEGITALSSGSSGSRIGLVSGGRDGTITSWDLTTRTPTRTVQGCRYGSVQALCHLDEHCEDLLIVGGQDGGLGLFRGTSLEQRGDAPMLEAGILCLCPLPGSAGGLLAGLADGRVAVVRELGLYGPAITYIKASENEIRGLGTLLLGGRLFVACAGLDRHLRLVDIHTSEQAIDIELDGYALSVKALGASVGLGSSAGAAIIEYPTDMIVLNP